MPDAEQTTRTRTEFESLLEPVLDTAYGMAVNMTRNRDEAADLVQETVVQAFRAFHTFQPGTSFRAWFLHILVNRFRYDLRKRRRQPEVTRLDDAPDLYLYTQAARSGLLGGPGDPAEEVLARVSHSEIAEAMGALPEEYRAVCALYFLNDMPYQEIAGVVNCPVGTVRSRLHRGRKLLQRALWMIAQEYGVVAAGPQREKVTGT